MTRLVKMLSFVLSAAMLLAGCPNPDNLVHYLMSSVIGATVHRVDMIDAAADRKLLDNADAHPVARSCRDCWNWLVCFSIDLGLIRDQVETQWMQ